MNSLRVGREKMHRGWKLVMMLTVSSFAVADEDELEVAVVFVVVAVVVVVRLSNNPASANSDKSTTYLPMAVQHRGVEGDR